MNKKNETIRALTNMLSLEKDYRKREIIKEYLKELLDDN